MSISATPCRLRVLRRSITYRQITESLVPTKSFLQHVSVAATKLFVLFGYQNTRGWFTASKWMVSFALLVEFSLLKCPRGSLYASLFVIGTRKEKKQRSTSSAYTIIKPSSKLMTSSEPWRIQILPLLHVGHPQGGQCRASSCCPEVHCFCCVVLRQTVHCFTWRRRDCGIT